MTRPRPSSSRRRTHHRDRAPECPTCETNLFIGADRGREGERRCHHCGWSTTIEDAVGEGEGSRVHGPARESAPHASPPPLHTDSESQRRPGIHGVCTQGVSE